MTPNRLASEKSPYLLQHAHNPVDWMPWGDDAFDEAARRDVPVFLSVGYATCHWCHVMERESFTDPEVARLLNELFVPVKVDREERPDVDAVYMAACQITTGGGGWPLTVLLTPDRKPFFAGTYFPRESGPGRIGMLQLLPRLAQAWRDRRAELESSADGILKKLRQIEDNTFAAPGATSDVLAPVDGEAGHPEADQQTRSALDRGFRDLARRFDERHGGFGDAPKFPAPHQLLFLLRRHWRGVPGALEMVTRTLDAMARGGICDQIGGGFHRYSTDSRWLVPHFEKMLHDQAMLAMAYTEAWQASGDPALRTAAMQTFEYVARDLTHSGGGFFSAEDADSEGAEGKFYVWSAAEFDSVVSGACGSGFVARARRAFGVEEGGNFRDEATAAWTGLNIPHRPGPVDPEVAEGLEAARTALLAARSRRPRPLLDDKVLADWNGLMIAALARAGRTFQESSLTSAAVRAADFVEEHMRDGDGGLLHRWRDGDAALVAGAADYAFMAWGAIELFGATCDPKWMTEAEALLSVLLEQFEDTERGGFFTASRAGTELPLRQKELYDGAIPSANSAALYVLARAARLTGRQRWHRAARRLVRSVRRALEHSPTAYCMSLAALDLTLGPSEVDLQWFTCPLPAPRPVLRPEPRS